MYYTFQLAVNLLGSHALLPDVLQRRIYILGAACSIPLITHTVCNKVIYLLMGYDESQTNSVCVLYSFPLPLSIKNM